MNQDKQTRIRSYGCLVAILVVTFILFVLLPPIRTHYRAPPITFGDRVFGWIALVVPWVTWLWYRFLWRSAGGDDLAGMGASEVASTLRPFWLGFCLWTITAVLMTVGTVAISLNVKSQRAREDEAISKLREAEAKYDPVERLLAIGEYLQAGEAWARRGAPSADESLKADVARIAARHRMTVAELEGFAAARPANFSAPTMFDRNSFPIGILLLDGLLILNLPVFRWLARVLSDGRWASLLVPLCVLLISGELSLLIVFLAG
jgi:hypothetical protein